MMIPIQLTLENFLAYKDRQTLDLTGVNVAVLVGDNGAGKSSLLDAITWCVWGKARGSAVDDMVHQGQPEMQVGLIFEQDGQRFWILRKRKAGKRAQTVLDISTLAPMGDMDDEREVWKSIAGDTVRDTQDVITATIGVDYETFINASMILQGRINEFTSKTASKRKQVLSDILMLTQWEVYEDQVKIEMKGLEGDKQSLTVQIDMADEQIAGKKGASENLKVTKAIASQKESELQAAQSQQRAFEDLQTLVRTSKTRVENLRDQLRQAHDEIAFIDKEVADLEDTKATEELQDALKDVELELAVINQANTTIEKLRADIVTEQGEITAYESTNQSLVEQMAVLDGDLATLNATTDPMCPLCRQDLSADHLSATIKVLDNQRGNMKSDWMTNTEKIDRHKETIKETKQEVADLSKKISQETLLRRRSGELEKEIEHSKEVVGRLKSLRQRHTDKTQTVTELENHFRDAKEAVRSLEEDIDSAKVDPNTIRELEREKTNADQMVGQLIQTLAAIETAEAHRATWQADLKLLTERLGALGDLREAFSKKGIPAMLIEQAVPELEKTANDLLWKLTDGRMHIRLDTQKEIQTGEMREALEIVISDELGSRPYEMYSGGESFKINFAIRIALSRMLARRAGVQLRSLFMDEGFGTQDNTGREQVVAAINSVADDFDCIVVITHIEELKDAFPTQIQVMKGEQGSTVKVIR